MSRGDAVRVLGLIDLTNLDERCSESDVIELCRRAHGPHGDVAAVCVWPRFVNVAVAATRGTGVRVATVVNFPHGEDSVDSVLDVVNQCVVDGADEIDLVIPYRTLRDGSESDGDHAVVHMVAKVKEALPADRTLKTILETGELVQATLIERAARLAIASGADFIKTSTGKTPVSATTDAVETMLHVLRESPRIDRRVGIKPSGGIRTMVDARRYLELADRIMGPSWATVDTFRFGASGLLDAVESELA
ncbi:MAG: deoxyribose-phosphate aldolase [Ilumatobacteraceae bacterium]